MAWYAQNARDLPWRATRDPYRIWMSEVILQQTRVSQGISYYMRITEAFPDVQSLASAGEDEVLKLWQGLGYYSRARNMHAAAKWIVNENDGIFPSTYEGIRQMKGVGEYTAAAIASIAFDLPHPVLDGNVFRVLTRLFGIEEAIDSREGRLKCLELSEVLLPDSNYGIYNQSIMEFGALQCVPKNPDCDRCIFKMECVAFRDHMVDRLPSKRGKTKVKTIFLYHFIPIAQGKTLVGKQSKSGIWKGLYHFPFIESEIRLEMPELISEIEGLQIPLKTESRLIFVEEADHLLSHRRIIPIYVLITVAGELGEANKDYLVVDISDLHKLPVSKMMERFLAGNYEKLHNDR